MAQIFDFINKRHKKSEILLRLWMHRKETQINEKKDIKVLYDYLLLSSYFLTW